MRNGAPEVFLHSCGYDGLFAILTQIAPLLKIGKFLAGKKILLKPNLISARGPLFACTDPRFILAVAQWFVDHGAVVGIGDSPAFGTATSVLQRLGIHADLLRLGAEVVEFTTVKTITLAGGTRVRVAAEALDCDLFVNLPKVKAHNQMYMTMAVKNIFGIVKGLRKSLLHMQCGDSHSRFAEIIMDLLDVLPAHLTLADGIEAMHIGGPLHGELLDLRCVAASFNPLAIDTALLAALELAPEKCPLWLEAKRRKCRGAMLADITFPLLSPGNFHGSGFRAPEFLSPIRFNPFRFLSGVGKRIILAIRS